jgi:hypothetical protein
MTAQTERREQARRLQELAHEETDKAKRASLISPSTVVGTRSRKDRKGAAKSSEEQLRPLRQ